MLPRLARTAIGARLGVDPPLSVAELDRRLRAPGASFVTLHLEGALRGCVGSLEPTRPLAEDVEANAVAAAFEDPRFPPLTSAELAAARIEVSVLGPLVEIRATGRRELLRRLTPGVDGLILAAAGRRATFLPQVWRALPDPADFVDRLRRKAGLDEGFWDLEPSFHRYRVRRWREE